MTHHTCFLYILLVRLLVTRIIICIRQVVLKVCSQPALNAFACLFQFVVDHLKHAFLCKFNEIQPNVFRDYLAELCRRTTHFSMHNCHRLVSCPPQQHTCCQIQNHSKTICMFSKSCGSGGCIGIEGGRTCIETFEPFEKTLAVSKKLITFRKKVSFVQISV